MNDWLIELTNLVYTLPPSAILALMVAIAYIENVIPPIPGDVVIVYGGFLAAEGVIDPVALLLLSTVASTGGFLTYFWLGWRWGSEEAIAARHRILSRFMNTAHIDTVLAYMKKYGEWVILANRFLAGTRSIISLAAGLSRMNWWQTAINATISSLMWNALLIYGGWQLKTNWSLFAGYLKTYGQIVLALIVIGVVARVVYKWYKRSLQKRDSGT